MSSAAEAGSLRLLDASGVAADWGTIDISASRQADIEMADTPTQSALTGVGSSTVSMFTTNGVAVKAVIKFAAEKLRDDCIAKIMNINYGEVVTASDLSQEKKMARLDELAKEYRREYADHVPKEARKSPATFDDVVQLVSVVYAATRMYGENLKAFKAETEHKIAEIVQKGRNGRDAR